MYEEDYPEKIKRKPKKQKKQKSFNKRKDPVIDKRARNTQKNDYLQEAEEILQLEEELDNEYSFEAWDDYNLEMLNLVKSIREEEQEEDYQRYLKKNGS